MSTPEARRLKQLEEENARLKRAAGDLTQDTVTLQDVFSNKLETLHSRRVRASAYLSRSLLLLFSQRPAGMHAQAFNRNSPRLMQGLITCGFTYRHDARHGG
jgi:hypothetical protein